MMNSYRKNILSYINFFIFSQNNFVNYYFLFANKIYKYRKMLGYFKTKICYKKL